MKKFLFIAALLGLSSAAYADWSKVDHNGSDMALYIDVESRVDSGHGTMVMWHLSDYATSQSLGDKKFRSLKGQDEFDCGKDVSRELLYFWHPDPMGNSQMVHAAYVPTAWMKPEAGSVQRTLMQIACKK